MRKADLIDALSTRLAMTRAEAETIVNTIFDCLAEALAKGDKVELRGFGTFRVRQRRPRAARNPKTGASIDVPQKRVPFFKAGRAIKQLLTEPRRA